MKCKKRKRDNDNRRQEIMCGKRYCEKGVEAERVFKKARKKEPIDWANNSVDKDWLRLS